MRCCERPPAPSKAGELELLTSAVFCREWRAQHDPLAEIILRKPLRYLWQGRACRAADLPGLLFCFCFVLSLLLSEGLLDH